MRVLKFSIFLSLLLMAGPVLAKLNVVTTTQDIAAIATAIGADKIEVNSLTKGTRDPHYATAKPSMIRTVSRADLLISIGAELEVGWLPALTRSARNSRILPGEIGYLVLSTNIDLKGKPKGPVTRDKGDVHAAGNPHYWLDPQNGIVMAESIANRLAQIDAGNSQYYLDNFAAFRNRMQSKITEWKAQVQFMQGKKVIAYHTSLLYLSEAFGFEIVEFIEPIPGISPSVSHLNNLIKKIQQEQIQYILMEPYYETRSAALLNRKTGIKTLVIPQSVGAMPEIETYEQLFDAIVKVISTGK